MEQINPATIFAQAALTSLVSGTMAFISSVVSNMIIQPMIHQVATQIGSVVSGALSLPQSQGEHHDDAPHLPFLPPKMMIPPPFFISFSQDGTMSISVPTQEVLKNLMPWLWFPPVKEGE